MKAKLYPLLLMLLLPFLASARTFEATNDDGVTIYYNTLNNNNVEVTQSPYANPYRGNVVIPSTVTDSDTTYYVTAIGGNAFYQCTSLTSVTIPDSVTTIKGGAFYGCRNLRSVTIPDSVTTIGVGAFRECTRLTTVVIVDSVTTIGYAAFSDCENLTAFYGKFVSDDNRCLIINGELIAFAPCGITDYTIPDSVTIIGNSVFSGCSGLKSVTIPDSVTSIGEYAFNNCSGLKEVHISDIATWCKIRFDYRNNPLFYAHNLYLNGELVKDLIFPDSVTEIGDYTFYGCSGLTSVTFGNSVTEIGNSAFESCSGLKSLNIPDSITSIGEEAFVYCSGLTTVTIGNSITYIGNAAFLYCSSLTSVTISESVISIGFSAFYQCPSLTTVTVKAEIPSICEDTTFKDVPTGNATLYVPMGSVEDYKVADVWKDFGKIVGMEFDGVEEVFEDEDGAAEYYNLRGVRIENPSNGLYIRRSGNKVNKVLLP